MISGPNACFWAKELCWDRDRGDRTQDDTGTEGTLSEEGQRRKGNVGELRTFGGVAGKACRIAGGKGRENDNQGKVEVGD